MPFALTFNKETIANMNALRTLLGHLNQHLLAPVEYKNHQINFQLHTSKADNSGMEKAWGNSVGGHYKCTECGINFATDSVTSFSSSLQVARLTPKSLQSIMEHCKAKTGASIGISFLPGILLDDTSTPLIDRGLGEYHKGHDHLHNTKGHMANLFSQFESEPGFLKKLAQQNLLQYVRRDSFWQSMKGSDWCLYFCLYEATLLPCIQWKQNEAVQIIRTWLEVQYFCYQSKICHNLKTDNQQPKSRKQENFGSAFWLQHFFMDCIVATDGGQTSWVFIFTIFGFIGFCNFMKFPLNKRIQTQVKPGLQHSNELQNTLQTERKKTWWSLLFGLQWNTLSPIKPNQQNFHHKIKSTKPFKPINGKNTSFQEICSI